MTEEKKCNGCGTSWTAEPNQCPQCGLWLTEYDRLKDQKRQILERQCGPAGVVPVKHMDMDESTISHEAWLAADDRTKEWYSIPLYAHAPQPEAGADSADAARFRWLCDASGQQWDELFMYQMHGELRKRIDALAASSATDRSSE